MLAALLSVLLLVRLLSVALLLAGQQHLALAYIWLLAVP
jgi:hypothetical protein